MTFLPVGGQIFMQICDLVAQGIGRFRLDWPISWWNHSNFKSIWKFITRVTVPIPFSLFQFSSNDTYCPNLLVLNLIENVLQTDRPWAKSKPQVLMQLEKLQFSGNNVSREHLMYLLSPPLLLPVGHRNCRLFHVQRWKGCGNLKFM